MAMLALGAPPALAALPDLPGEVVKTAGSTIESVTTTPPPPAPTPTEASTPEQVRSDPVESSRETTSPTSGAPAGPLNSATGYGDDGGPAADQIESGAEESVAAAGAGSEQTAQTAPSSAEDGPGAVARPRDRHGDATGLGDGKRLHGPAESGPVGWFFTYVWPAVALGKGEALPGALVAGLKAIDPLPASEAADLGSGLGGTQATAAPSLGNRPSPKAALHDPFSLPVVAALSTPLKIVLYLSMSILLAALAFTVWTEFSAATRRPHHWGR